MADNLEPQPIRPTLSELKTGERAEFPSSQYSSVASTCTNYGFESGRRFTVRKDRENNKTVVTRIE